MYNNAAFPSNSYFSNQWQKEEGIPECLKDLIFSSAQVNP